MKIENYLTEVKKFQKHPKRKKLDRLTYLALGLNGESGEVAEEIKKAWRNKGGKITATRKGALILELGDVFNLALRMCKELDTDLETVLELHLEYIKTKQVI